MKVTIHRIVNDYRKSNSYLIEVGNGKLVCIDCGEENASRLLDHIKRTQKELSAIFLTHEHPDHVAGADCLVKSTGANLYSSPVCSINIRDPKKNLSRYSSDIPEVAIESPCELLFDEEEFFIENLGFKVFFTPGHSPGSITIRVGTYWFTGDTILNEKTALGLPHSNLNDYVLSIKSLSGLIKPNDIICPGHGDDFIYNRSTLEQKLTGKSTKLKQQLKFLLY